MVELNALLAKAKHLHAVSLTSSAKTLASNLVAALSPTSHPTTPDKCTVYVAACILFADCLASTHEYIRAINHYAAVLNKIKSLPLDAANREAIDLDLRVKTAVLYLKTANDLDPTCKRTKSARTLLEGIPDSKKTMQVHITLAHLYDRKGLVQLARKKYMDVIRIEPHAVEAYIALVRLGCPTESFPALLSCIPPSCVTDYGLDVIAPRIGGMITSSPSYNWFEALVVAHHLDKSNDYSGANKKFEALEAYFAGNVEFLLRIGDTFVKDGNVCLGHYSYSSARKVDPDIIDDMDKYACLIRKQGKTMLLNKLAEDLLEISQDRAECYLVLALYFEAEGNLEKALGFVDKAIECNSSHAHAHKLRADVLSLQQKYDIALKSYRKAATISKDIFVYQGMVNCYLSLQKIKEASSLANECVKSIPGDARGLALVARVLAKQGNVDKAREVFEKAVSGDKKCIDTTLSYTDFMLDQDDTDAALVLLKKLASVVNSDIINARIGEVYAVRKDWAKALAFFGNALTVNGDCKDAIRGRERVDRMMNGGGSEDDGSDEGEGDESFQTDVPF